ncbi:MarR family transcriptional regulator [Silvimonas sp. JCM 19000]
MEKNLDLLRLAVTSSLLQAGRHWRTASQHAVDKYNVSAACATPLLFIGRLGEGVRQVALADYIGIEGPSLVRLLDQLCSAGLVRREEDAADRRAKTLWYTAEGKAVSQQIEADLVSLRASVLKDLSAEELEGTLRLFRAVEAAAQAAPQ